MSNDPNEELLFDENGEKVLNPKIREQLRNQEKELVAMKKQVREAELKSIFAELGIPSTGLAKLFRDGYQGDATLEAVRSAASQYEGLIPATTPAANELDSERQAELDALRRVNGAGDSTNTKDVQEVLQDVLKRLKSAKNVEEFDDIMASPEVQSLRGQPISFA
ncbi:MAG: hypothetical protein HKL85_01300 [Acidimicrobiaceae bacterium]|nr:hypothetical protein [Acidimicrobiaceae bacterium]